MTLSRRTPARSGLARMLGLAALLTAVAACPMPAPYTLATSSPVLGRVEWADGTPAAGLSVLLSTETWTRTPCEKVALHTTTDTAGRFELAGTFEHHSVRWVVPNLDLIAPRFLLCASVHDTVLGAYTGVGSLTESAELDSVSCLLWRVEGSPRATCAGHTGQNVVTGGFWTDSTSHGRGVYRLLLTSEPTQVGQYKKGYLVGRPYLYVQWLEPIAGAGSASARYRVDTTVSIPIDRNKVTSLWQPQLWRREGRWMASAQGSKREFMNDFAHAELVFQLGGPGDVTRVAGP